VFCLNGDPFILCMFIDQISLILVVIPIYQPLLGTPGLDPTWFWLVLLGIVVFATYPPLVTFLPSLL